MPRLHPGRISGRIAILVTALALPVIPATMASATAPHKPVPVSASTLRDGIPHNCAYTNARPTIRRGSTGAAVRQAQCYLNDSLNPARHRPLAVDGDFGPLTATAVRTFQRCVHITVDGIVGPVTWGALRRAANSPTWTC